MYRLKTRQQPARPAPPARRSAHRWSAAYAYLLLGLLACIIAPPAASQTDSVRAGRPPGGAGDGPNSYLVAVAISEPAPGEDHGRIGEWFALRTVHGDERPFDAFAGRVLFVNFWATWCAPCVKEMPSVAALAESMADVDVEFLLISIDEDERAAIRFASDRGLERFVYFRGWEPWTSTFSADMVPATFVVKRDGIIVLQHHGAADWNTDAVRRFLRRNASE